MKSISTKITQKINEAKIEQYLDKHETRYDNEKNNIDSKIQNNKEKLKFLDLSKISLGFELSFSLPRIFAFLFMIICFVFLILFHVFYPIVYLFGIFIGVVIVVSYLFVAQWYKEI